MATLNVGCSIINTGDTDQYPNVFLNNLKQNETRALTSFRVHISHASGYDQPTKLRLTGLLSTAAVSGSAENLGGECVTELWLEAKTGAGAWTAIGGDPVNAAHYLALDPSVEYQTVDLRVVVPADASTSGAFSVILAVFYDTET